MDILKYIQKQYSHFNLTDNELAVLGEHITVQHFKRNQLFLEENTTCKKMGLLITGIAYSYIINNHAEEVIQDFYYPSGPEILFDYESYFLQKKSNLNIKFQEEAIVSYFYIEEIKKLYNEYPRFLQFEFLLTQQEFVKTVHKNQILQVKSAEEKITLLQHQNPKVFELFPYVQIASYLGIHRNTFRRVFSKH
ncbi:cAMP-binding domain of CRP or a regulatory subunit of cAMP-dependent protein kinases [Mesonia phycicola]|uniref:cAMP-binding domain of CRP or a regulatory subunit of cAMP-dependent protein kinases n=1 Tax=Mesonia phycicola TaxID=579105 RepID=A0A1M6A2H3_9FLAO|nr:Crp/Fnr family transcriptional regulator [Mesonia phycicola]SHI30413.1 cAMP-binding domain of CRP or a regulatory subunit of cAMP-dependent protein kinases [Mesonia phycicola]